MKTFFTWVVVLFVLFIFYSVQQPGRLGSSSAATTNYSSSHSVEYRVSGPDKFSITYEDKQGGTAQIDSLHEKWNTSFSAEAGRFLYISVQNGQQYGAVVCEIWVDGVRIKQTTSQGAYVIATCSAAP